MTIQPVCLDVNIILEILFERQRYSVVVGYLEELPAAQFCVSTLAISTILYFVEAGKYSKATAWKFLNHYRLLDVVAEDIEWARDNDQGDFEDALQVACARRHGCREFITLDTGLQRLYGTFIPVTTLR